VATIELLGPPACGRFPDKLILAADRGELQEQSAPKKEAAKKLIEAALAEGRMDGSTIKELAESQGISESTLRDARRELGVRITLKGYSKDKKTFWSLDKPPKRRRRRKK
jgi:hypothetical protein